ncbi:MAG TPA: hypothetical protein VE982_04725 [Gaiellaceae bacterium]|nr:hypothetical protein [Gaiellaceae bacterium]
MFGRRIAVEEWIVEVDYGSGWIPYGPPIRDKLMAATFARDLRSHGHAARVAPAPPAEQPEPPAAAEAGAVHKPRPRHRRRRHGRPSR